MFYSGIDTLFNSLIQKDPWFLVDFLTSIFGFFMNIIYNVVNAVISNGTLGITIILLTIFVRLLMLPMMMKQQKSMTKMQALTPEIESIKKKYEGTKDPEITRKMNVEIQEIYTKNGVNPFASCLPIFIQLPMFIALNYVMNQPYLFINKIGSIYESLATSIMSVPNYLAENSPFYQIAYEKVPRGMEINISIAEDVQKVLNKLTTAEWETILNIVPEDVSLTLTGGLTQLQSIEHFMGIDLTAACGWSLPGIIIPILAAFTTFLSTYLTMKKQPKSDNPAMQSQQKVMMYGMPIFMGFITVNLMAGVGIYWITSNIFQICQQLVINKSIDVEKQ